MRTFTIEFGRDSVRLIHNNTELAGSYYGSVPLSILTQYGPEACIGKRHQPFGTMICADALPALERALAEILS